MFRPRLAICQVIKETEEGILIRIRQHQAVVPRDRVVFVVNEDLVYTMILFDDETGLAILPGRGSGDYIKAVRLGDVK